MGKFKMRKPNPKGIESPLLKYTEETNIINISEMNPVELSKLRAKWSLEKKYRGTGRVPTQAEIDALSIKNREEKARVNNERVENKQKSIKEATTEIEDSVEKNNRLNFVKESGNQVLAGEDPISQAFSYTAAGGLLGGFKTAANLANLNRTAKTINAVKKAKDIKTFSGN